MMTNLIHKIRYIGFLMILSVLAAAPATAKGDDGEKTDRAARIVFTETLLSNLGYWITSVDAKSDDSTRQAIIAFQKVNGLKRTGVIDDKFMAALVAAERPAAKHAGPAHVEIDLDRQVIFLVDDGGAVTHVLSTSTGNNERYQSEGKWHTAVTPRGVFTVTRQIKGVRKAPLGTIYYPSYFNGGVAIHGSNSIPVKAASHGCARIPRFAEKKMSDLVKVGMTVYVY